MTLDSSLTTIIRSQTLPVFISQWCDKSWALFAMLKDSWESFDGTSFNIPLVYADPSNVQTLGPKETMSFTPKEFATQGNDLPRMVVAPNILTHDQILSLTNKEAITSFATKLAEENLVGMEKSMATSLYSRSASTYSRTATSGSTYRMVNLYDILYLNTTPALHNLTYSDFTADTTTWQAQQINGNAFGADVKDNLENPQHQGYIIKLIRRAIMKAERWGQKSDLKCFVGDYDYALLNSIKDSGKVVRESETMAKWGFRALEIDDVPIIRDGYMAKAQSADTDGWIMVLNMKYLKFKFNGKAAFTSSDVKEVQGTTQRIFDIRTYGNFYTPCRRSHVLVYNVYNEYQYI